MITADEYNAQKDSANVNSLSEFYTIHTPKDTEFPTYNVGDVKSNKTTYVNQLHAPESAPSFTSSLSSRPSPSAESCCR